MFLIDYAIASDQDLGRGSGGGRRRRMTNKLMPENYRQGRNRSSLYRHGLGHELPQHIPQRFEAADVAVASPSG